MSDIIIERCFTNGNQNCVSWIRTEAEWPQTARSFVFESSNPNWEKWGILLKELVVRHDPDQAFATSTCAAAQFRQSRVHRSKKSESERIHTKRDKQAARVSRGKVGMQPYAVIDHLAALRSYCLSELHQATIECSAN